MSQRKAKQARQAARPASATRDTGRAAGRNPRLLALTAAVLLAAAVGAGIVISHGGGSASALPSTATGGGELRLAGTDPVSGGRVSLAAFAGKPVVLNMWASWCTGCAAEAAALASFERGHPGAQVIGIDIQDTRTGARSFYRRFGWRHPSIFDPDGAIAARLGLQGLPTTLFLDARHRIVARIVGEATLAQLDAGLHRAEQA